MRSWQKAGPHSVWASGALISLKQSGRQGLIQYYLPEVEIPALSSGVLPGRGLSDCSKTPFISWDNPVIIEFPAQPERFNFQSETDIILRKKHS